MLNLVMDEKFELLHKGIYTLEKARPGEKNNHKPYETMKPC